MNQKQQDNGASSSVPALRRSVQILDLVASSKQKLSAAHVTQALDLPKSTAHGLIAVLCELNLLARAPDGSLRLGSHPLRWANSFLAQNDIPSVFQEYLVAHRELDRFTVTLTILEHADVVYIGCRNSDQPLDQTFRIGMRLPAPFTATGKMLLCDLGDEEISTLLGENFPPALTPRSVPDLPSLKRELVATRARGYSIDDGQIREGMICIGAGIKDHSGRSIAGIAISLLRSEASDAVIASLGETMRLAAANLSRRLGAS